MFECPRCHYKTELKHHLQKHFQRKKECSATYSDTPLETLLQDLNEDPTKIIHCQYCDKKFSSRSGLFYHNKTCNREAIVDELFSKMSIQELKLLLRQKEQAISK